MLEMANGDPLRAQEIEAGASRLWVERWMAWSTEREAAKKSKK